MRRKSVSDVDTNQSQDLLETMQHDFSTRKEIPWFTVHRRIWNMCKPPKKRFHIREIIKESIKPIDKEIDIMRFIKA